jgi:DNA-binding beta-propeller fold protein YncE
LTYHSERRFSLSFFVQFFSKFLTKMKIMTFSKNTLWAMLAAVIFTTIACKKGDEKPESAYASGVFISCEGPFGSGTGTVSYYNRVDSTRNDIYGAANSGAAIGNVLQSYTVYNGVGYLLANNANKIVTVDPKTFITTATYDTGFVFPRYAVGGTDGSRLYVTTYGKGGLNGTFNVFDLASKKISRTIATGKGASKMLLSGGKIWVVNDGGTNADFKLARDSSVVVIRIPTLSTEVETFEKRIKVGAGPNSIVQDNNGNVWVLCGGYDYIKPDGKLYQIRNEVVVDSFSLPSGASSLTLDNAKTTLYFLADNKVYAKDPLNFDKKAPSVFLQNAAFVYPYGLGVDPKTGYLYVADAKDFTKSGEIYVFDPATKAMKLNIKTGVGVGPNGFYFN